MPHPFHAFQLAWLLKNPLSLSVSIPFPSSVDAQQRIASLLHAHHKGVAGFAKPSKVAERK